MALLEVDDLQVAFDTEDGLLRAVRSLSFRVEAGQTGAVWQRRTLAALEEKADRDQALSELLERYLELQATGEPVHTWPVDG